MNVLITQVQPNVRVHSESVTRLARMQVGFIAREHSRLCPRAKEEAYVPAAPLKNKTE